MLLDALQQLMSGGILPAQSQPQGILGQLLQVAMRGDPREQLYPYQSGPELDKIAGPSAWRGSSAPRSYQNAPDSLMGFRRNGPNRGFDETNYPHTQYVDVTLENGDRFVDAIRGMNQPHAIERAYRNWPAQNVKPISYEDAIRVDPALAEPPR